MQNIRIITLCHLLCAGVFFSADAQVTTFQKLYGTPLTEYLFDLVEYSQGGYVATGVQYQGMQNGDIYIYCEPMQTATSFGRKLIVTVCFSSR